MLLTLVAFSVVNLLHVSRYSGCGVVSYHTLPASGLMGFALSLFQDTSLTVINLSGVQYPLLTHRGLPKWLSGKEPTCQCRRHGFSPWVGKTSWRRKWQPTPVCFPGKSHRQRSLAGSIQSMGSQNVKRDLATEHKHRTQNLGE